MIPDEIFTKFFAGMPQVAAERSLEHFKQHTSECRDEGLDFFACDCGRTLFVICSACQAMLVVMGADPQPCDHALEHRRRFETEYDINDLSY